MKKIEFISYLFLIYIFHLTCCPPVFQSKKNISTDPELDELLGTLDYRAYLTEVLNELHNDEAFSKNLNNLSDTDAVANGLKHASGKVRSKLDELKRVEIMRLNKLQSELKRRQMDDSHPHEMPFPPTKPVDTSHLDDIAPDSFNPEDLKRLIVKTSEIFNKIDKKDEETYKYHEMEKKAEKKLEFEKISDENLRKINEEKWNEEVKKKRSQHKTIHNPGSVEHLKSVWKEEDHMDAESFNPKSFFLMHDMNNDGNWDIAELETLMQRELDKAYDPDNNDTDLVERYHEMTRMRNALLSHADKDGNHLISFEEFNQWILDDQYKVDKEWKIQEELEPNFTDEEFNQFYKEYVNGHPELYMPPTEAPTTKTP